MRKLNSLALLFLISIFSFAMVVCTACGSNQNQFPEKVELSSAMIREVQFENDEAVKLEQNENQIKISGTVNGMSKSQKHAFGDESATHVVVIKITFDTKRTISYFKLQGNKTKVYSDDNSVEGYTGKLSELLDNEDGEDAYCNLILSANTSKYSFVIKYSDGQEVQLALDIVATLAVTENE